MRHQQKCSLAQPFPHDRRRVCKITHVPLALRPKLFTITTSFLKSLARHARAVVPRSDHSHRRPCYTRNHSFHLRSYLPSVLKMAFSLDSVSKITPATTFLESVTGDKSTPEPDRFHLQRYVDAQDRNGIFDRVLEAIRDGGKIPRHTTEWLWFIFPQMDHCKTRYRPSRIVRPNRDVWPKGHAITNLEEARAILRHPILGPRMQKLAETLLETRHADIFCVLNHQLLDVQRVHSTMTIFREASRRPLCLHETLDHGGTNVIFRNVLDKHFALAPDSGDEMTWGEPLRPLAKRSSRHPPTIQQLEIRDMQAVEKRMASKNMLCVCANKKEELNRLDDEFVKKVEGKRKKRAERG